MDWGTNLYPGGSLHGPELYPVWKWWLWRGVGRGKSVFPDGCFACLTPNARRGSECVGVVFRRLAWACCVYAGATRSPLSHGGLSCCPLTIRDRWQSHQGKLLGWTPAWRQLGFRSRQWREGSQPALRGLCSLGLRLGPSPRASHTSSQHCQEHRINTYRVPGRLNSSSQTLPMLPETDDVFCSKPP